jgi:DNA-binding NtrC family response regulator
MQAPRDEEEEIRPLGQAVSELERKMIRAALEQSGGNKASTARLLGISRATLYQKLAEYQIVSE